MSARRFARGLCSEADCSSLRGEHPVHRHQWPLCPNVEAAVALLRRPWTHGLVSLLPCTRHWVHVHWGAGEGGERKERQTCENHSRTARAALKPRATHELPRGCPGPRLQPPRLRQSFFGSRPARSAILSVIRMAQGGRTERATSSLASPPRGPEMDPTSRGHFPIAGRKATRDNHPRAPALSVRPVGCFFCQLFFFLLGNTDSEVFVRPGGPPVPCLSTPGIVGRLCLPVGKS